MKKSLIAFAVAGVLMLSVFFSACYTPRNDGEDEVIFMPNVDHVGVWWWNASDEVLAGPYLEFAARNGVTEIYLHATHFGETISDFMARAYDKNIAVYWLHGNYNWIHNDTFFRNRLAQYLAYQQSAPEYRQFAGIHVNVEPHQDPTWHTNRAELIDKFVSFLVNLRDDFPNLHIDKTIPFWFNDIVNHRGNNIPLHQAVMLESCRTFLMTYRDSAERMFNLGTVPAQVEFARSLDKPIFLSAEIDYPDEDGTVISFRNLGKRAMYEQLNKLKYLVNYEHFGIAIHHIRTWYNLKN